MLLCSEGLTETAQAQTVQKKVLIVMVEFSNAASVDDARGSRGITSQDPLEFKYRYHDYHDIFFKPSGNVTHPDASLDPTVNSEGGSGWFQYGSFAQYIEDNSFGACEIVPAEVNESQGRDGILNNVIIGDNEELPDAKIVWLPIDLPKQTGGGSEINKTVAEKAFLAMESILPIGWDWYAIDAVLIMYAGNGIPTAGGYTNEYAIQIDEDITLDMPYSVCPERAKDCFGYPGIWFHELIHATTGTTNDLYYEGVGHYSPMGYSAIGQYTPPLLDPWHRVKFGWLGYQLYNTAGDYSDIELPIVNVFDSELPPHVLVIPVNGGDPSASDWEYRDNSFLIVENRRPIGWDRCLRFDDNADSPDFRDEYTNFEGGFLIWGAGTLGPDTLRPYQADGDYTLYYPRVVTDLQRAGDPIDFYDGEEGRNTFGVWTKPGLLDRSRQLPELCNTDKTRSIYLSFDGYNTTTNRNTIGRLVLDQLIVDNHEYGSVPPSDDSPTKYNNQSKVHVNGNDQYLAFNSGGIAYVAHSSNQGSSWRDLFVLTPMHNMGNNRYFDITDNVTLAASSEAVWALFEEYVNGVSDLVLKKVTSDLCSYYEFPVYNNSTPLRASIAGMDAFLVMVTPQMHTTTGGLYVRTSTDHGASWSSLSKVTGTFPGDANPSITVRKETNGQGQAVYFYDITYEHMNSIQWYSSEGGAYPLQIPGTTSQPNHDEATGVLHLIYQKRTIADPSDYSIGYLRMNANSGNWLNQPLDVFGGANSTTVLRDPRIVSYDDAMGRRLLSWIEGAGDKLYLADNHAQPNDWFKVRASALGYGSMTSYPIVFSGASADPLIATTRLANNPSAHPQNLWRLGVTTMSQDDHELDVKTGKKVEVENGGLYQGFRHKEPTVHDGTGSQIGSVRYDYSTPSLYWGAPGGTPFDTLTTTMPVTLIGEDNIRYSVQVTADTITDTTFVEGYMLDVQSQTILSVTGEFRIPPGKLDTTLVLGLELPNGVPSATVTVHTRAWRGLLQGGSYSLTLEREHIYSDSSTPKQALGHEIRVPDGHDILTLYPTPTLSGGSLTMLSPFDGDVSVSIHSVLGCEVYRKTLTGVKAGAAQQLQIPRIAAGMYVVTAGSAAGIKAARIHVR